MEEPAPPALPGRLAAYLPEVIVDLADPPALPAGFEAVCEHTGEPDEVRAALSIAWLDTSADEQRRVREMLRLFTEQESRDEPGIAQIRYAFSESLFPDTSVIQTLAR